MSNKFRQRNQSGAVMAESVASLWLIVTITVASVSLLINTGMSMFYKQKISFIAMQTATYTAQLKMNEDKKAKGEALAKKLIENMGMSIANSDVQIKEVVIEDTPSVTVEITISKLPLIHNEGGILPFNITLADRATAIKQQAPEAYVWLNNNAKMSGFLIPVVRMPPGGVGATGLPYVIP